METVSKTTTTKKTTKTVTTESSGTVQQQDSFDSHHQAAHNVTIIKKGNFFNDSCFEDTRQDFQDAIKDVVSKWGDKTTATDDINNYRNIRAKDMRDENQAVKSSDDQRYHKIVVDVQDFVGSGGEVTVKTVDETEVVVEGKVEKVVGSSRSFKSFKRSFILPDDVDPSTLTSVVSADGVLIIKATKIVTEQDTGDTQTIIKKTTKTTTITTGQQGVQDTQQQQQVQQAAPDTPGTKTLTINKKGGFFEDTFFEDSRQHFQNAVKQVLEKCNETSSQTDDLTTYRNLRQRNLEEKTQAVTECDSQDVHRIIVDVQDFLNGGEVTVKTVNENEVVIEGRLERKEGNKTTIKKFCKRFILEEDIEVETVTSVVSSDGVLTITARRKPSPQQDQQTNVSQTVNIQKTTKTQQQTSQQVTTGQQQEVKDTMVQVKDTQQVQSQPSTPGVKPLPIDKKGGFFEDTFFEDSRQHFQNAVKQVLEKCNETSSQTDDLTTYRNLRQRNLEEKTQAVTECDSKDVHRIIVDVQDFLNGGEVTVKTVNDNEVVIEGRVERKEGNKTTIKKFCKRFILEEDIEVETVTSVVSSDGVLTITARRKPSSQQPQQQQVTDVNIEKTTKTQTQTSTITQGQQQEVKDKVVQQVKDTQVKDTQVVQQVTDTQVKDTQVVQQVKDTQVKDTQVKDTQVKDTQVKDTPVKDTQVKDTQVVQQVKDTQVKDTQVKDTQVTDTQVKDTQVVQQVKKDVQDTQQTVDQDSNVSSTKITKTTKTVTITKKGGFFDDSCFEDSRQDYQKAVKQVLEKNNVTNTQTDDLTTYRNLRKQDIKEETQAVTESDRKDVHTIIVDVQDFADGGEVTVRTENENEVVIEGRIEKQEGNKRSMKKFCKRFILEEDVIIETITSVVSSDGILTVTFRKKPSQQQDTEVSETVKKATKTQQQTTTTTGQQQKVKDTKDTQQQVTTVHKDTKDTQQVQTTQVTDTKDTQQQDTPKQVQTVQKDTKDTQQVQTVQKDTKDTQKVHTTQVTDTKDTQKVQTTQVKDTEDTQQTQTTQVKDTTDQQQTITTTIKKIIKIITIIRKGAFFEDSVFEKEIRENYQNAIRQVLKKCNITTTETNVITTYRNLRQKELKEENQAVTEYDTKDVRTYIVDVQDFINGGEVTVKTVDGKEILVEGHIEKQEGNTKSTKKFCKRFILPDDAQPDTVNAVMSSDGVLTITVRRTVKDTTDQQQTITTTIKKIIKIITIIRKGAFFEDSVFEKEIRENYQNAIRQVLKKCNITTTETNVITTYRTLRQKELKEENQAITECDTKDVRTYIVDVQDFINGGEVTVKTVDGKEILVEGHIEKQEGNTKSTKKFCKRFVLPDDAQPDTVNAVMSSDGVLTITVRRTITKQVTQVDTEQQKKTVSTVKKDTTDQKTTTTTQQQQQQQQQKTDDQSKTTKKTTTTTSTTTRIITVTTKGPFFSDPAFNETVQDFKSSIKTVTEKFKLKTTETDSFNVYREYRKKNPKNENQAVSNVDNEKFMRMVMDVCDFIGGLTVKLVEGKEIVVEGKGTREQNGQVVSFSFCRRFTPYSDSDFDAITAVMSAEGVLVINVPRKQ